MTTTSTFTPAGGPGATGTPAARAVAASKLYGHGPTAVRALDEISLDLAGGRLTAIMGPSGSGKSTLLHCMAGLDGLTSGRTFVGERDLATLSDRQLTVLRRDEIGFVFQAFNLVPTLTARENIVLPFTLAGRRPDEAWFAEVVDTVGLADRLTHRPSELSGGQQQRVAVARALVTRPRIVFADEPTGNLDSHSGAEILGFLRRAVDELGQTVAMVTHDPVAAAYADLVVFLADGRVVDRMDDPTAQRVLDRMKELEADMVRLSLSSLWNRRRRALGTSLAVLLGVAFLTGTLVLGDTLSANFDTLFRKVSAGTSVVVRNRTAVDADRGPSKDRGVLDGSLVDRVRAVDGVAAADGQVLGYGSLLGTDGKAIGGNGPPRQAGSWIPDPTLNPYRLVAGRAPERAGEVVVNRGAADAGGLHLGDVTTVQTPAPVRVRIVGIATFGGADGFGTATFAGFTLAAAQQDVIHQPGQVTSILVRAAPGVSDTELRDRIRSVLPSNVEAITGAQLTQENIDAVSSTFLDVLRALLIVFAGIALAVAALSINNTFSITVAQRTRELALLRAVGASRRQVRASVAIEALAIGVVAAAIGVVAGLGVAGLLKGMFDAFGFALPAGGLTVLPSSALIAAGVGVLATFVAAQLPARRAAHVAPIAALRDAAAESRRLGRGRIVTALAILVAGGALAGLGVSGGAVSASALGAVGLLIGGLLLAPLVLRPVAALFGAGLRRTRGAPGLLAEQNARRNPRRSASTATALVIGVAVVSLFTLFAASLRATLNDAVQGDVKADLVVSTPSFGGGRLAPGLPEQLRRQPGVADAVGLGGGGLLVDGDRVDVTATQPSSVPAVLDVTTQHGSFADVGPTGLAVSHDLAHDRGWHVGSRATLTFPGGATQPVTVRAIYDDNTLLSDVVVPEALWNAHVIQPSDSLVLIATKPGTSAATVQRTIAPLATRNGGDAQSVPEFVGTSSAGLNTLLNIVYVMLALAILIALLGIANALSLAVYERRTELGLLRAVGETRRQVRSMLRWESVIVSTFGTVFGLVLGAVLGGVLFATVAGSGGTFALPVARLVIVGLIGALAGVVAAIRPARRAARVPVLEAITAS